MGDTIRVSLTEQPEEEIDPCRRLATLGMRAAELQQGVVGPFFVVVVVLCGNSYMYNLFNLNIVLTTHKSFLVYKVPFEEKHRHYFTFQRRSGQLPMQKEVSFL